MQRPPHQHIMQCNWRLIESQQRSSQRGRLPISLMLRMAGDSAELGT